MEIPFDHSANGGAAQGPRTPGDYAAFQGPGGPGAQGPRRPHSFFDSIRASGWYRADNRTVGGVCAGIAARTGWDLVLVRGLALVLLVFVSPLLAAYGAAWALLPEQRDGRIHFEELLAGRLDAAQFGSGLLVLMGLGALPVIGDLTWGSSSWGVSMLFLAVVGATVVLVVSAATKDPRLSTPPRPQAPLPPYGVAMRAAPPTGGPVPRRAPDGDWRTAERPPSSPWRAAAPAPHVSLPLWTPPIPIVRPRVGKRTNLVATGLVLLTMATTFAAMYWLMDSDRPDEAVRAGLGGAGACLLLIGAFLARASLKDRSAGWLVALSVIGVILAMPTALLGLAADGDAGAPGFGFASSTSYYGWDVSTVSANASGLATLDLTSAPAAASREITVDGSVVDLTLFARRGQAIRIICSEGISDVVASYWVDDAGRESADWVSALRSCEDASQTAGDYATHSESWREGSGITIRLQGWLNALYFSEDVSSDVPEAAPAPQSSAPAPQSGRVAPQSGGTASPPIDAPASGAAAPLSPVLAVRSR